MTSTDKKPLFEVVTTSAGVRSIRNNFVNETMHNPVGPWAESNELYIKQSQLEKKLQCGEHDEVIVFDVGLGAAANAVAAFHCAKNLKNCKTCLRVISFEKDLRLLEFTLKNASEFEHLLGFESALSQILTKGHWSDGNLSWELREGDFTELIKREELFPNIVFFDPYSPAVNEEMWTEACFKDLYNCCSRNKLSDTTLFTYSRATPIRAALFAAGFFVGSGDATGLKSETTQAATYFERINSPLDRRWLQRWHRSHTPYPFDCTPPNQENFRIKLLSHPQFQKNC